MVGSPAGDSWQLNVAEGDIPVSLQLTPAPAGHTRIDPSKILEIGILCDYVLQ